MESGLGTLCHPIVRRCPVFGHVSLLFPGLLVSLPPLLSHQIECWVWAGKIKLLELKMCVPQ